MDQGIYIASPSTCERVMKAYYQGIGRVADRNIVRRKRPEYSAKGPNQVWCWDITWLHSEVTGKYYYLYLIIDMYSRYIVGWSLHTKEDGKLAEMLFAETLQNIAPAKTYLCWSMRTTGNPCAARILNLCLKSCT
ncbi:integrase-like protein [Hallerella porci]|uniref:Integrase-like protein n=2 Tax=Hallerella porci TaxID=1945871 RepID=A0ABX5LH54_9BACT|nr:integrase-like protein [Hallerella porci]